MMGRSFPATSDKERHHRSQTSKAMKRVAAQRRCPACQRGFALKRTEFARTIAKTCRWCGYCRVFDLDTMQSNVENPGHPRGKEKSDEPPVP